MTFPDANALTKLSPRLTKIFPENEENVEGIGPRFYS